METENAFSPGVVPEPASQVAKAREGTWPGEPKLFAPRRLLGLPRLPVAILAPSLLASSGPPSPPSLPPTWPLAPNEAPISPVSPLPAPPPLAPGPRQDPPLLPWVAFALPSLPCHTDPLPLPSSDGSPGPHACSVQPCCCRHQGGAGVNQLLSTQIYSNLALCLKKKVLIISVKWLVK